MTRQDKINSGKLWQVYYSSKPDDILFEGSRSKCLTWLRQHDFWRLYKRGTIRIGKLIWEKE